ncbi:MAG: HAD hydrolase-like protein [Nanoarchaeota archaeon]|nr:HAD hydrolase-like protein [Nanoarchaeota archaeon]
MMVKAIIFDYDGVIVDSFENVYEICKKVLKELNRKVPSTIDEFRELYGYKYLDMYDTLKLTEEERTRFNMFFRNNIVKKSPAMFKHVDKVIKTLSKSYTIAMVSANYIPEINEKLKKFGILDYFKFILCRRNLRELPITKADVLLKAVKKLGLNKDEVVYIGDRTLDYDNSIKAGVKYILVDYGWGYDKDKVPEQKVAVKKPLDILKAIKMINS